MATGKKVPMQSNSQGGKNGSSSPKNDFVIRTLTLVCTPKKG